MMGGGVGEKWQEDGEETVINVFITAKGFFIGESGLPPLQVLCVNLCVQFHRCKNLSLSVPTVGSKYIISVSVFHYGSKNQKAA